MGSVYSHAPSGPISLLGWIAAAADQTAWSDCFWISARRWYLGYAFGWLP